MHSHPAVKVLLLEETADKALREYLQTIGYEVASREFPDAAIWNFTARLQPQLLITHITLPISQTLVEMTAALQARFRIPVVYLASPAAEGLMKRLGINDYLCWPGDRAALPRRLGRTLGDQREDGALAAREPGQPAQPVDGWLFWNSPTPLYLRDFSTVVIEIQELKASGIRDLRAYFSENPKEVTRFAAGLRILDANQAALSLYHARDKETLLANQAQVFASLAHGILLEELVAISENRARFESDGIQFDLNGNLHHVRLNWSAPGGDNGRTHTAIVSVVDMTEQKRKQDTMQFISMVTAALRSAQTRPELLAELVKQINHYLNFRSVALAFGRPEEREFVIEQASGEWLAAAGRAIPREPFQSGQYLQAGLPYVQPDIRREKQFALGDLVKKDIAVVALPLQAQKLTIGQMWVGARTPFSQSDVELLTTLADITANAVYRATLYEHSQLYAEQVSTVSAIGRALSLTLDVQEVYEQLAQGVLQLLPDISGIYISTYDNAQRMISYAYGQQDGERLDLRMILPVSIDSPTAGSQSEVILSRQPLITNDLQLRRRLVQTSVLPNSSVINAQSGIYVPMLAKDEVLGVLYVQSYCIDRFSPADGELLGLVANNGAIALQNARLFAATQRQVQRLTTLHAIDVAISSSLDLRVTLNTVLDQLLALLQLDAADILMLDPATQALEYASGRGFRSAEFHRASLNLRAGLAMRAALENSILCAANISASDDPRAEQLQSEGIVTCYAVPLSAKGHVKGVLEFFYRKPVEMDLEWKEFLETLAGQVAVALDNATLVTQLQRTNQELTMAYETTLEGWARALYLRDRETESHTRRVTEYSVQIARAMGLTDPEVTNIRRGALLHDIGKLGIPDNVLLKTGPLNETEWNKMRLHPGYANDMLKEIQFLGAARLIPYCHHEKWDGTGYPQGLKGEQIPLSARIFAVADVWDSLLSDRPYRPAWPREKVREYIKAQAGTHFDPQVVEVFLKLFS